ncbi:hypothetical protein M0R45_006095 [Rubus argutus]|uniref:Reverse transcriptase domain-containing protein n=1 Tax=Rubus argutus TaxID=59490 RepID=A0AAW1YQ18_RUBAR
MRTDGALEDEPLGWETRDVWPNFKTQGKAPDFPHARQGPECREGKFLGKNIAFGSTTEDGRVFLDMPQPIKCSPLPLTVPQPIVGSEKSSPLPITSNLPVPSPSLQTFLTTVSTAKTINHSLSPAPSLEASCVLISELATSSIKSTLSSYRGGDGGLGANRDVSTASGRRMQAKMSPVHSKAEEKKLKPPLKRKKRIFRFEEGWLLHEDCLKTVELGWDCAAGADPFSKVCFKISNTRRLLMDWSKNIFGNILKEIEKTRAQLATFFYSSFSAPPSPEKITLEGRLNELLHQEQTFWKQRAKVFWLTDDDLNTKFFHRSASNRKKKNSINGLYNEEGVWCTADEDLERTILNHFGNLFSSSLPTNISEIVSPLPCIITDDMNVVLSKEFTEEEIHSALKQMHPTKAPGPDGFSPCFYQHFWPLVGKDVVAAVRSFLGSDSHIKLLNRTHVTLIPKVKRPEKVEQLRPISLCNVLYKIGSKVLANRLKPLLHLFISPYQSAFVPGRLISDNSLIAFEIAHFLKRRRDGKVGYGALKLDLSKAYDRVEWPFLEAAMLKLGFSSTWVEWIMRCVRTVSYSFILNGVPRGKICPSRGLRQGDAISPYLFLICAEVLSRLISVAEDQDRLHGVRLCSGAPSISHLLFADDSLIFFKANADECVVLKDIFINYEMASGQKINFDKSCVSFSKNVMLDQQLSLASILTVERVEKHDLYLGLPMEISYSKVEAFGSITEKVQKKIQSWREKNLSAAGKEVMIKAVIQSIPTYVMSCFELPKQICQDIHQLMARFWWGDKADEKKIHWVSWEKLCVSKSEGGLGFRNLNSFNLALLAKQGWRLITLPESLVSRIFKALYFPNSNFMQAVAQPGMSFTWRSILVGREVLSRGTRFQIGTGLTVSLWNDPWIPLPHNCKPFSCPRVGTEAWVVGDLIDQEQHAWKTSVIKDLFSETEASIILKIPLSLRSSEDCLIWHHDKSGVYEVKSGYHVTRSWINLTSHASSSSGFEGKGGNVWQKIWRVRVPPKVRAFIWRLLKGIVPTRMALFKKKVLLPNSTCVFCNAHPESDVHVFLECDGLLEFWHEFSSDVTPDKHHFSSIFDLISDAFASPDSYKIELLFMCLWVIWSERNNIIWKEGNFKPLFMAAWTLNLLEEYQKFHRPKNKINRRPFSKWEAPPRGRLKINCDGAYKTELELGGIGVVVRNEDGNVIASLSRSIPVVSSAFHTEVEACRAALLLASQQGWDDFILETDCANLVSTLERIGEDFSEYGRIIDDCREYMLTFNTIEIRHIYREANCVANRLAHIASISTIDKLCLNETPSIIEDVLIEDMFSRARGFGIMSPSMYTRS